MKLVKLDIFREEQYIYDQALSHAEALKNGAPFDLDEYTKFVEEYGKLLKHLRRLTYVSDKTVAELYEDKLDLTGKVHYDSLTGVYNRRFLDDSFDRVIRTLARSNENLSILMIDVDFFKNYNDTYGHSQGDECLKSIAKTIMVSLARAEDFAVRYGGEEFVTVLPRTDKDGAVHIAKRILKNVMELNMPHEKNEVASCVTVSVGVTTGDTKSFQNADDYIERADEALYVSKRDGRNRYTYLGLDGSVG